MEPDELQWKFYYTTDCLISELVISISRNSLQQPPHHNFSLHHQLFTLPDLHLKGSLHGLGIT
jgi:hypothetical protein